jgi:hypothetical protein
MVSNLLILYDKSIVLSDDKDFEMVELEVIVSCASSLCDVPPESDIITQL